MWNQSQNEPSERWQISVSEQGSKDVKGGSAEARMPRHGEGEASKGCHMGERYICLNAELIQRAPYIKSVAALTHTGGGYPGQVSGLHDDVQAPEDGETGQKSEHIREGTLLRDANAE
jgi:hypothetical protein